MLKDYEEYVKHIDTWHTPASDYPEGQVGNFRLIRKKYYRGSYRYSGMDGFIFFKVDKPIPIMTLQEKREGQWHAWMVDDPLNYRAMQIYAEHAHGRVLVAGLGLGLYVHELAKNKNVELVMVIEKSAEVMALVDHCLPSTLPVTIQERDFYDFLKKDMEQWDTILVDLWVSGNQEQKLDLYYHHVLPLVPVLGKKYPKADVTFHGFQTVSAVKPVSQEMVDLIISTGGLY